MTSLIAPIVREIEPGDAEGCARAWRDAGRFYAALVPDVIQEPADDGLVEWFEAAIREERDDDAIWLVAEHEKEAVGFLEAAVVRPAPDARWQLQLALSQTRLVVNALAVAEEHRHRGVGTALMRAAEDEARSRGATISMTDTNLNSPLSVPFYEAHMGYRRQAVILRKPLIPADR